MLAILFVFGNPRPKLITPPIPSINTTFPHPLKQKCIIHNPYPHPPSLFPSPQRSSLPIPISTVRLHPFIYRLCDDADACRLESTRCSFFRIASIICPPLTPHHISRKGYDLLIHLVWTVVLISYCITSHLSIHPLSLPFSSPEYRFHAILPWNCRIPSTPIIAYILLV